MNGVTSAVHFVSAPCPACGSPVARPRFPLDFLEGFPSGMNLVKCRDCGTERIDPHPDEARMRDHYDTAYYHDGYLNFASRRRADFRARLAELEGFAPVVAARLAGRAPRLLDIGAGVGLFAVEAAAAGYDVTAVDPSPAARATADRLFGLALLEAWPAAGEPFDLVTFWDVLGHLERPLAALQETRARLLPGGGLVLKIPNFRSSWYRVRTFMSRRRRVNLLYAPTVIWRFDQDGAERLLSRAGFAVASVATLTEPDLLPLTPRWRGVRRMTRLLDGFLDNREGMIVLARAC